MKKHYLISFKIIIFLLLIFPGFAVGCPICQQEKLQGGKCVDVNGYQLYMQISGIGKPNIILESGLGDTSASWDKIVPQINKFARIIIYDRNGLGKSQTKPNETKPRTAQQVVTNLHSLLKASNVSPPYILVGHSMGGLYMQLFAQKYPQEVFGVVLVDSATYEQKGDDPLPPKDAQYYWEAAGIKESIEQVKHAPSFPHVPLIVITTAQRGKEWLVLQKNLTKLSPCSEQIIVDKSGHYIQREQPEVVIEALKKIVTYSQSIQEKNIMRPIINFIAARNKHDMETALNLFANNIIWLTSWNETLHGKKQLKEMFEKQFNDNITNEIINPPQINNDTAKFKRRVTMESWRKGGIDYLIEDTEVTVKNNKIIYFKSQYTKESVTKLKEKNETNNSR